MKKFMVTFKDVFEAETEDQCYDKLREYLTDCVNFGDVTAFEFEDITSPPYEEPRG